MDAKLRIIALLRKYRKASKFPARHFEVDTLGKFRGWLDDRKRFSFDVAELFQVLELLQLDPVEFMREVFDGTPINPPPAQPASKKAAKRWARED